MSTVVVFSGGLDSTTLLYKQYWGQGVAAAVSFNYGQRHEKELQQAKKIAEGLGIEWILIDLSQTGLVEALQGSTSLIKGGEEVPEGHYTEENMKSTVVPNRNMMMISIAGAIAVAKGANSVSVGVHSGDHAIYPDCRTEFINSSSTTLHLANEGMSDLKMGSVEAPFVNVDKTEIARQAFRFGVPIEETWSCYKGGENHCGRCGTCVERLEALNDAYESLSEKEKALYGRDRTVYEDNEFWKKATQ